MHYALVTTEYRAKLFLDRNSVLRYVVHQNQRCLAATLTCVSKTTKGFTHVVASQRKRNSTPLRLLYFEPPSNLIYPF